MEDEMAMSGVPRRSIGKALARAAVVALAVLALGPAGVAMAEPPALAITSPSPESSTPNPTPTIVGTTNDIVVLDQVTVTIYSGTTATGPPEQPAMTATPSLEGTWSVAPSSPLPDGPYTTVATQTNSLTMETGTSKPPVTFTVDTVPPTVSINPVASPTKNATPTLAGGAGTAPGDVAGVTVKIYQGESTGGGVASEKEVQASGGAWSYTPSSNLPDGIYTAQATQLDAAGNQGMSMPPVTFTIDTTPPVVSIDPVSSPTREATPTLEGSASEETEVAVTIYQGGSVVSTKSVPVEEGRWSYTPPHLNDGTYTAEATQQDAAGNQGVSKPVTFTVDTTPPEVSIAQVPSPTKDTTPTLEGHAGTAAGDGSTVTIELALEGGNYSETVVQVKAGGVWSLTSSTLPDGTYTARVSQRDSADNHSTSAPMTFTVDTRPPSVDVSTPAEGSFVSTQQPTFSGHAGDEAGDGSSVTLRIYAGGPNPVQTVKITRNGGSWTTGSKGPHLTDGTYTVQATQSDAAENIGQSAPRTFTIKSNFPMVKLNPPGQVISNSTPSFTGNAATATGDIKSVTLTVYRGESTTPENIAESLTAPVGGDGTWMAGPTRQHLPDGTYIAQAEQKDGAGHAGVSEGSIFTIDTIPPHVTLTSPSSGSTISSEAQTVTGTAGITKGDLPAITIQMFAGSTVGGGEPLESVAVNASKGLWSATLGGLGAGTYTVRALQRDEAGNVGVSGVSIFTVSSHAPTTPLPSPQPGDPSPAASFTFFPTAPKAGESVSLASSSTDAASPIIAYAWDLAGSGPFQTEGPVLVTSFATPGSHVVRLRVTAADGLSSIVAGTIAVVPRRMPLMQPFPIVRIVGSDTRAGARLSLLSVQAPVGARVTVGCRGGGCPAKPESRVAVAGRHGSGAGAVVVAFRRFERSLRAGASLEIRVSKPGEIGKYTRFRIRRNRAPVRVDACLDPTLGPAPTACPSS